MNPTPAMTLEPHNERSSDLYNFQLTTSELSYLRHLIRANIEETLIHRGGKYHETANKIYAKLCKGYVDQPEIKQRAEYRIGSI